MINKLLIQDLIQVTISSGGSANKSVIFFDCKLEF